MANLESANRAQSGIAQTNVEKAKSTLDKCIIETNKVSEKTREAEAREETAVEAMKALGVPEEDVQEQRVMFEKVKSRRAGEKTTGGG